MTIKKLFKKETIAESAGIVLFFTFAQRVLLTGKGIVFARILGPADFGVYSIALFFIPIVAAFARLGMPSCYPRYVPHYEKQRMMRHFLLRTYLITSASSLLLTVILLLFADHVSSLVYDSTEYGTIIIICALSLVPLTLFETIRFTYNGLRVFKLSYLMVFTQTLVFAILGITLVLIYRTPEVVILSILLSNVIVVIIFGLIMWKYAVGTQAQAQKIQEKGFYKKIFKYSIWFVISPVIFSLFKFTDKWMINQFLTAEPVGFYAVMSNLTSLVYIFGVIAGKVLMPNLSSLWEQGEKEKAVSIMDLSVRGNTLLLIAASLVILLPKEQIIKLLYGGDYLRGAPVVGTLLIFWMLNCVYLIIAGYAGLIEKTYIPLIGGVIGIICNVILNYILIPPYGLHGAAIASTSSFAVTIAVLLFWYRIQGLRLKASTMIICLLPCIFFLDEIAVLVLCAALAAIVFGTELLITKEERKRLTRQVSSGMRNFRRGSRNES